MNSEKSFAIEQKKRNESGKISYNLASAQGVAGALDEIVSVINLLQQRIVELENYNKYVHHKLDDLRKATNEALGF